MKAFKNRTMEQRYEVARSAISCMTGRLEAHLHFAEEKGNYELAIDLCNDLIALHKEHPIHMSKKWVDEFLMKRKELMHLLSVREVVA